MGQKDWKRGARRCGLRWELPDWEFSHVEGVGGGYARIVGYAL